MNENSLVSITLPSTVTEIGNTAYCVPNITLNGVIQKIGQTADH